MSSSIVHGAAKTIGPAYEELVRQAAQAERAYGAAFIEGFSSLWGNAVSEIRTELNEKRIEPNSSLG